MFSKNRAGDTGARSGGDRQPPAAPQHDDPGPAGKQAPAAKPAPSVLSTDLTITGNVTSTGDIQIEGTIEGDIHAHLLTVGESATVRGEVIADDVVVNGHVIGRVRGLKVRLTSTARVEGDIIHKTIAIESGAHFEGSVQRHEDPLKSGQQRQLEGPSETRVSAETGTKAKPASAPATETSSDG